MFARPLTRVLALLVPALLAASLWGADYKITLTDYTSRGFAPDLVTYNIDAKAAGAAWSVTQDPGQNINVQVTGPDAQGRATLSFIAHIPLDGVTQYTVRDRGADGPAPVPGVRIQKDGDGLVLENAVLAVRVPAEVEKTFATPVAASTLPAPVLKFKSAGAWLGAGKLLSARPVKAMRVKVEASGPVFAMVRYELEFADGGFYRARIQVIEQVPLVKVSEEYQTPTAEATDDWELNLTEGWAPDSAEVAMTNGNSGVDAGSVIGLPAISKTPDPIAPAWVIVPDSAWHGPRSQLGLFDSNGQQANPDSYKMAGFVPLHKGDWRRMTGVEIRRPDDKQLSLRFPMSVRHATWLKEITSETSPFSAHEHDPELPATYGRRHWGLVLAKPALEVKCENNRAVGPFYQARLLYGVVGLDRYKDYVLDWPDTGVKYPRLFVTRENLERMRQTLKDSPLAKDLANFYLLAPDQQAFMADANRVKNSRVAAENNVKYTGNFAFISPTIGHHKMGGLYFAAAAAQDVLCQPDLPAETRQRLRARMALICYVLEEPDVISYGNGSHTGPPNMGVARAMGMSSYMALIPDHPMHKLWREHMARYTLYKDEIFTAPGGAWFEYGGAYHMHGYARITNALAAFDAVDAPYRDELYAYHRLNWDYYLNLITPYDTRWRARMIPGLANSGPSYSGYFIDALGSFADRDPAFAANLKWAWMNNARNTADTNVLMERPWIAPVEPKLTTQAYPGVGMIFRAHQGPQETYMFLRSGFNWSHWTEDQGHMIVMAKGATVFPFQTWQYGGISRKDYETFNVMRFGHPENKFPHGWPDSNIIATATGPSVDYAWSSTGFPEWYVDPAFRPGYEVHGHKIKALAEGFEQKPGEFHWNRQVMFLKGATPKSPTYFAVRDTTRGEGRLAGWLMFNMIGKTSDVKIEGGRLAATTEFATDFDLLFAGRDKLVVETHEENFAITGPYFSNPANIDQPASPRWTDGEGKPLPANVKPGTPLREQHLLIRVPGPAPETAAATDYFWLIYPRGKDEKPPAVTRLSDHAIKVVTGESTDYVLLSPAPTKYEGEGVVLEGTGASVRVGKDAVTLALTSGAGAVGYKGHVLRGAQPFERTVKLSELKAGVAEGASVAAVLAYEPKLQGHEESAPGVRRARSGDHVEYLIDQPAGVTLTDGEVRIDASEAAIHVGPQGVRIVVPRATYAQISVGTQGVRGVGPFDITITDDKVTGIVDGGTRSLVCTYPAKMVRPMYHMDGVRWLCGIADDHSFVRGRPAPQFALAFGVTAGRHQVELAESTYPPLPPSPPRRGLP